MRQAKAMLTPITALLSLFAATVGVRCASVIPSDSFSSISTFEAYWNYLYPWGSDHNGSTWALLATMILISWNRQVRGWKGTPQTIAISTRLRARFRWLLHQHLIPHHPPVLQIPTQQFTIWGMVVLYTAKYISIWCYHASVVLFMQNRRSQSQARTLIQYLVNSVHQPQEAPGLLSGM